VDVAAYELLGTYLNEHLAGSASGVELAERLCSDYEGTPLGTALRPLAHDIKEDRASLEDLMEGLGIEKSSVKQAVGWGLEKLSRLRINKQLIGSSELTRLLQIETLSLGVEGKLAMWRALQEVAAVDARLAATDFDRLIARARQQRETLEPHRLEAAAKAFSP
jgi:hypothetical protein